MGNWFHTFLAQDFVKDGKGQPDAMESLQVLAIPVPEVEVRMGTGEYVNSLALVALDLYHRHIGGHRTR